MVFLLCFVFLKSKERLSHTIVFRRPFLCGALARSWSVQESGCCWTDLLLYVWLCLSEKKDPTAIFRPRILSPKQAGNIPVLPTPRILFCRSSGLCGPWLHAGKGLLLSHLLSPVGQPLPGPLGLGYEEDHVENSVKAQWVRVAGNLFLEDSLRRKRRRKKTIWCKQGALQPVSFSRPVML